MGEQIRISPADVRDTGSRLTRTGRTISELQWQLAGGLSDGEHPASTGAALQGLSRRAAGRVADLGRITQGVGAAAEATATLFELVDQRVIPPAEGTGA